MTSLSHQAIYKFGEAHQILKCIEELQELTIELAESLFSENKQDARCIFNIINRAKYSIVDLKGEIDAQKREIPIEHLTRIVYEVADVAITLDQMMVVFDLGDKFGQAVDEKKEGLGKMISGATP